MPSPHALHRLSPMSTANADQRDAHIAMALTLDEARRIASNTAKLPHLLGSSPSPCVSVMVVVGRAF